MRVRAHAVRQAGLDDDDDPAHPERTRLPFAVSNLHRVGFLAMLAIVLPWLPMSRSGSPPGPRGVPRGSGDSQS